MSTYRAISLGGIAKNLRAWQVFVASLSFALPFALLGMVRSSGPSVDWEYVSSYPGDTVVRRLVRGYAAGGTVLYATGAYSGLHLTVDGGKHWSAANEGLPQGSLGQVKVIDLALDPSDPGVAYAVVDSSSAVPRPMVYWTADMGLTWQPRASLGEERVRALAFGPTSDDLYVVTANELLRAFVANQQQGRRLTPQERFTERVDDLHWQSIGSFDLKAQATMLAIGAAPAVASSPEPLPGATPDTPQTEPPEPSRPLALYVGTRGRGLWQIVDQGAKSSRGVLAGSDLATVRLREQATIQALCVDPRAPSKVYVGTDRGLYLSDDAGQSYRLAGGALKTASILSLAADPRAKGTLYAGLAREGVYYSADDGATWRPLGQGLKHASAFALVVDSPQSGVLYAGTDNGLWRLKLPEDLARLGGI